MSSDRLRPQNARTLPKTETASALCRQWVRCGRRGCRCAGGELHGPYIYLFWREAGRLRKRYVRQSDAALLLCAYAEEREQRRQTRSEVAAGVREWQQAAALLREVEHHGDG